MVKNAIKVTRNVTDPSPEEIRTRAEAIRRGWTSRERLRRAMWKPAPWMPKVLAMHELAEAFAGSDEYPSY
jgi:hypothetical protein